MGTTFQVLFNVGGCNNGLATFYAVQKHLLAVGIQLREDIIQEENGFFAGFFFVEGELQQLEGQEQRAVFATGCVG